MVSFDGKTGSSKATKKFNILLHISISETFAKINSFLMFFNMPEMMKSNFKFSKLLILAIFVSFGIFLLGWAYYIAYTGIFLNSLFWASLLIIGFGIFLIILDKDISEKYKIIFLFLFGIVLYITNILPSTTHFHFADELATYETTRLIYENGNIGVNTHFEIAKLYPALELLTVISKIIINIDIFVIARILIGVIHPFILIFLYMFLKKVGDVRIAAIGTFIYATNPLYIYFHSLYSYESLGIFFGIFLLYSISRVLSFKGGTISDSVIIIIVIQAMVISHHLSSLMILLFISLLAINQIIAANYKNFQITANKNFQIFILTLVYIFVWMTYFATPVFKYLYDHLIDRFSKIFELSIFGGSKTTAIVSTSLKMATLPKYEYIIDNYMYSPLFIFLSIIGILFIKKNWNRNWNKNAYIYTMIVYGPILYIISIGFILTAGQELAIRMWGFVYIALSLIVAIAIDELMNRKKFNIWSNLIKIFSLTAVILILMGGISIADKPIHRVPDLLFPKLSAASGTISTDVFYAAGWFEQRFGRDNKMIGDFSSSVVFEHYGYQNASSDKAWKVFFPDNMDKNVSNFINDFKIKYIIVDKRITQTFAEYGTYFSDKELTSEYRLDGYGHIRPLPKENIEKFDFSEILYKIYDNGNICIYDIYDFKKSRNL